MRENFQNLRKWVRSLCAPLRPFRSELKENFYHSFFIVDVHPYKNISLPRYRVPRKTVKFVPMVQNLTVGPTFVRTKSLLSRSIFKNVLGLFIGDDNVVVHPCSNFSLRRQMALLQSIKYQTAYFPIFLRTCYCDFLNNVYS